MFLNQMLHDDRDDGNLCLPSEQLLFEFKKKKRKIVNFSLPISLNKNHEREAANIPESSENVTGCF